MKSRLHALTLFAGTAVLLSPLTSFAQTATPASKPHPAAPKAAAAPSATASTDVIGTIKGAADALGMLRSINRIDAINRMEFWASGTANMPGQTGVVEYHATVSYNPPGMRVDVSHGVGSAAQHTIQAVNDKYSWNETEPGAGLAGSKGTATAAMADYNQRYLQLWTLPYGAIKAALAAGDQARLSNENGATVITFPLSGKLSGVTVKATLNAKKLVTKVETSGDIASEFDYSEYGDHGDDPSDVQFPGHIVEKQAGKIVLDLKVKMDDPNNPFAIFPTPPSVMQASK